MKTAIVGAGVVCVSAMMAAAQEPAPDPLRNQTEAPAVVEPSVEEETYPSFDLTLTPAGEFTFGADLKDGPGGVSISRAGMNLTLNLAATQQLRFGLSADVEGSWYDFNNATTLIPGVSDPFDDMYMVRVSPSVMFHFSREWAVLAGGIVEFAGEPDADVGDSFTGGGFAGVRHRFSETFAVTLGAVAKTSLEDDLYVFPLIAVEWQITPDVTFSTSGLGGRLTAKLNKQWGVFMQAGYQLREFRLEDTSALPEGVVRDRRIPIGLGLTWSPTEMVSITLRGGVTAWQEFEVDNRVGTQVSEINTKPAPYIGLSADFHF